MELIGTLFKQQPMMVLFLTVALGYLVLELLPLRLRVIPTWALFQAYDASDRRRSESRQIEVIRGQNLAPTGTDPAKRMATQPVETALDMATLICQSGGSAAIADIAFQNVLKGNNVKDVSAVYRVDFIAASGAEDGNSWTILRPLAPAGVHVVRASEAVIMSERLMRGEIDASNFAAEAERIKKLPSPHGRWSTLLAAACTAAAFSKMMGGDWGALGVAFVAAGIGQLIRPMLLARKLSRYAVTFLCALISGFLAVAGLRLGFSGVAAATLIASVIYMVPGVPLINGFVDITSGKHFIVGLERLLDATSVFFILAIAVAIADIAL